MVLCAMTASCTLLGGLRVDAVATSVQKPSNVALYVAVRDSKEPIDNLLADNFKIFENEDPVPPEQSSLTLLERGVAVLHHALVLVDMSTVTDDEERRGVARAVSGFIQHTRRQQGVTVYAFDGSPDIRLVGDFQATPGGAGELEDLPDLAAYTRRDPSRNLHGAIAEGLKQLDARLMHGQKPVRVGTLVVFTRGPDVAGRLNADQIDEILDKTPHHVVTIGIGKTDGDYFLDDTGRSGVVRAQDRHTIGIAFEEAAARVSKLYDMYYLVSYCSPARAGKRRLRLEVSFTTPGGEEKHGSVEHEFDATGFGPGCDPNAVPKFVLTPNDGAVSGSPSSDAPAEPAAPAPPSTPPKSPAPSDSAPPAEAEPDSDAIVPPPEKPGYAP
jgi:hypothetical protein